MEVTKRFKSPHALLNWLIYPKQGNFCYRGISNDKHLYPSIMRCGNDNWSFIEDEILREFSKYSCSLVGNINNAFDLISYAQHFGLPTRLVDWTRNPLVALFFALYYADREDNSKPRILSLRNINTMPAYEPIHTPVAGEDRIHYNNPIHDYTLFVRQIQAGNFPAICVDSAKILNGLEDATGHYANKVYEKERAKQMIMLNSGYSNARLLAQDGLFYLPRLLDKAAIDHEYEASKVTCIEIDKSWRSEILLVLEHLGITKYKLFFDLASVTEYIIESTKPKIWSIELGLKVDH